MKNILKRTIIFAACLTLSACGTSSPQDITIQSITEPMTTMQTVGNVPEAAAVTENTDHWTEPAATEEPDDWTELAMTDGTDNTNAPALDPPMQEISVKTVEEVTFPEAMDDWEHSYIIRDLFDEGLTVTAVHGSICSNGRDHIRSGISDYNKCNTCYKKLLLEEFLDDPDNFELFGGAFFCDGWFHLFITDWEKKDDVFGGPLADSNIQNVSVASCDYSYSYLLHVLEAVIASDITYEEGLTSYGIEISENRVYATVLTEEVKEKVLAAVENAGFDTNAVNAIVCDYVIADPC